MVLDYPDPPLTDGVVRLRAWTLDDAPCIQEAARDAAIRIGTTVPGTTDSEAAEAFVIRQLARVDRGEGWSLAITKGDGPAIGLVFVGIRPQEGVVGLGYWLLAAARGAGLATRAVALATDWALTEAGEHRVEAWVVPDNTASQALLSRCGFHREGVLRSFLAFDGCRADAIVYSRLASDDSAPSGAE